jgi:aminoglycoside phosphotransferase (APT) family kinase protein
MPDQKTDAVTIENEKQLIKEVAGLSNTDEIVLNDRGWDSRVYSFDNGHYFFKFPRSKNIQEGYKYEIAAIKFITTLDTDVVAQKILWEHPENAYFGYKGVQGKPLNEIINSLGSNQKQAVGKTVGNFLKKFHELVLPGARTMTTEDEAKQIQRWYEDHKSTLPQWFSEHEQQRLHELVYKVWPSVLAKLSLDLVLSHGDLHFENILYSQDDGIGIIDFGDVAYYDRSKDFLELQDDTTIFTEALEVYGHSDPNFMKKIAVRQAMIQIINFGFYSGKEDGPNTKLTVEKIRANFTD